MVAIALTVAAQAVGIGGQGSAIAAGLVAALGLPVGVWLAVTRYRLYDLDQLLARTLSYATLAVRLALLFLTVVAFGGRLLLGGDAPVAVARAASATATAVAPARARCGAFVQRSVLGLAGDPPRAATFVGRRLGAVSDPDLLPAAAAWPSPTRCTCPGSPWCWTASQARGPANQG